MICEFNVGDTKYFLDGENLILHQKEIDNSSLALINIKKKEVGTLNKAIVVVSDACNGRCVYCYENDKKMNQSKVLLTKEKTRKIITELSEKYYCINRIEFFGGEPLLNFEIIKYFVKEIENQIQVKEYEITTNGILLTDGMIDFFRDYNFNIVISLDGPKEIHDKLRVACPYDIVIDNLKKLKKSSIADKILLNCTFTRLHLKYLSFEKLFDFFEGLGLKYTINEVITDWEYLKLDGKIISEEEKIELSYKLLCISEKIRITNSYVKNVISALVERLERPVFCPDLEEDCQIVWDVRGEKHSCMNLICQRKLHQDCINQYNLKINKKCKECWAKNICTECIAPYIVGESKVLYNAVECKKEKLYLYSLEKLIYYYREERDNFIKIIKHFYT